MTSTADPPPPLAAMEEEARVLRVYWGWCGDEGSRQPPMIRKLVRRSDSPQTVGAWIFECLLHNGTEDLLHALFSRYSKERSHRNMRRIHVACDGQHSLFLHRAKGLSHIKVLEEEGNDAAETDALELQAQLMDSTGTIWDSNDPIWDHVMEGEKAPKADVDDSAVQIQVVPHRRRRLPNAPQHRVVVLGLPYRLDVPVPERFRLPPVEKHGTVTRGKRGLVEPPPDDDDVDNTILVQPHPPPPPERIEELVAPEPALPLPPPILDEGEEEEVVESVAPAEQVVPPPDVAVAHETPSVPVPPSETVIEMTDFKLSGAVDHGETVVADEGQVIADVTTNRDDGDAEEEADSSDADAEEDASSSASSTSESENSEMDEEAATTPVVESSVQEIPPSASPIVDPATNDTKEDDSSSSSSSSSSSGSSSSASSSSSSSSSSTASSSSDDDGTTNSPPPEPMVATPPTHVPGSNNNNGKKRKPLLPPDRKIIIAARPRT